MIAVTGVIFLWLFVASSYGKYGYETKYINVPVDHFSMTDNRTFSMRYLINDSFWKPNYGPIFFYTGNEGDIEVFAENTGFLWEAAEKFKALVVFAEHRYYGVSDPFKNKSKNVSDYFSYLSSQQALADYVDLLYELKNYQKFDPHHKQRRSSSKRSNPVIAFGGSYGGMLAAWMRLKYPAVIEGALASSAPIWQFTGITPCEAFNKVLTKAYNSTSPQCVENIRRSWAVIRSAAKQDDGKQWINKNWKLCKPIENEDNLTQLLGVIAEIYTAVGMVNYPYPTNFLMPLPGNPVKEVCKHLSNDSLPDEKLLIAVYNAISVYNNYTGKTQCFDWSSDPYGELGAQLWNIQACTEMVMPICSNGISDMFEPSPWNISAYSDSCFKNYKVLPKEQYAEKEYGGRDLRYSSNIIFSNGLLDPWSGGGVTQTVSPSTVVVLIPESAHHLDLRAQNEADPLSVVRARKLYVNIFRRWIRNYRKQNRAVDEEYDLYLQTL